MMCATRPPSGHTQRVQHKSRRHLLRFPILLGVLGVLAACTSDSDGATPATAAPAVSAPATDAPADIPSTEAPPATEPPADTSDDPVANSLTVLDNANNTLSAQLDFELGQPAIITVTAVSGDHSVELPPTAQASDVVTIPLVGMRSDRTYTISAALSDVDGTDLDVLAAEFTTGSIPDRFVPYVFESDLSRSSPGYTIIEMQELLDPASATPARPFDQFQYLIAVDSEGEVVWYYQNGPVIGAVEQTVDGNFTSIYWPNGVREFDMLGNEVGEWLVPIDAEATADVEATLDDAPDSIPGGTGLDAVEPIPLITDDFALIHHEAQRTVDGNFLALSATSHDLTDEQRAAFCPGDDLPFNVLSDVAVEFTPEGEILRTWDLWDVIDVDAVPGDEMCNAFFAVDGARDWTHANAVVYDADRDAVIFSARHTSQVVAMPHGDDFGPQTDLLWTFGDNGTLPLTGDGPRYQHAVEVQDDGSILLYDNGNGRPGTDPTDPENPPYSRAVLYDVDDRSDDPADWQVTQLWEHRADDLDGLPLFAAFIGDADRVSNGNVLITHGGTDFMNPTSFLHTRILEVVPDGTSGGDIVWQFDAGAPGQFVATYRAERIDSFYVGPEWAPLD
jgi:hypothetical protein